LGPAEKNKRVGGIVGAEEGAKEIPHSPSITIGVPLEFNFPIKVPSEEYALIYPSPKFPTRMTFELLPSRNPEGAIATHHGAFRSPCDANRFTKLPSGL